LLLAAIISQLHGPESDLYQAVIETLAKLGDKQAVPALLTKLEDPDAGVRRAVIEVLGKLGDKQQACVRFFSGATQFLCLQ
jgi:HEAT repeat protein